jgi:hypothetical protein
MSDYNSIKPERPRLTCGCGYEMMCPGCQGEPDPEETRTYALLEAGKRIADKATSEYEPEHLLSAPCLWCGYNGQGYWQQGTHAKDCPWHKVGGVGGRLDVLLTFQPRKR